MRKFIAVVALAASALVGCGHHINHHDSRTLKAYTVVNPDGSRSDVCSMGTGEDLSRVMGNADEPVRHPAGDAQCNER